MKVFLVRHAVAHERDRVSWPDDSQRPLTSAGKRKFRKAARGLANLMPGSTTILTSPFVRARQTADILSATAGGKIIECPELAHGGTAAAVLELLRVHSHETVVLVGHEPEFGRLLAAMLGTKSARFDFRKGGAACVEFEKRPAAGGGTLVSFLPPKVLRAAR